MVALSCTSAIPNPIGLTLDARGRIFRTLEGQYDGGAVFELRNPQNCTSRFTATAFDASYIVKDLQDRGDDAGATLFKKIEEKIGELERIGHTPEATRH